MPDLKKKTKYLKRVSLTLFFCLILSQPCFAMGSRHRNRDTTLKGRVTNQLNYQPVTGASIIVSNFAGKIIAQAQTDTNGYYSLKKELYGLLLISCSASGYHKTVLMRYLSLGQTNFINFSLKPLQKNSPPKITSFFPKERSTLVTGDTLKILVNAYDPDKNPLSYKYLMDGKVIKDWTTSSKYEFKTTTAHRGRHKIEVKVGDGKGGFDTEAIDIYVFRAFPKPKD